MQPTDVRVAVADGVRLRVRSWVDLNGAPGAAGETGRPGPTRLAYLLVHGLASNALLWDEVARHLAKARHPVYAVDLRSHGESDAPDEGYDTATAARDLVQVCRALAVPRVVAVGQSWGGNVVARFAAEQPDLVGALALVDGGWIDLALQFASWQECAAALRPDDIDDQRPEDIREYLRRHHPDWAAWAVEATLANLRATPTGHVQRRLPIPHHMSILRSMWDEPPWPDLAKVEVPALLLPAIPADEGGGAQRRARVAKAALALAQARVREYVDADHDLHAQHPAEVAADLLTLAHQVGR